MTAVNLTLTGGVSIAWLHAECVEIFSFTTIVNYRIADATEWSQDTIDTRNNSHVIDSILFPPNAVFQFKVNTRYEVDDQIIISDDSEIHDLTIPGEYSLFGIVFYPAAKHAANLSETVADLA